MKLGKNQGLYFLVPLNNAIPPFLRMTQIILCAVIKCIGFIIYTRLVFFMKLFVKFNISNILNCTCQFTWKSVGRLKKKGKLNFCFGNN